MPYAPCSPEDLRSAEYDYFALGHVHDHKVVTDGDRVAAFSGNLQGRHPKETGPKGALVVDVEPDGRASVRHEALDVARWAAVDVDVTGAADLDDVLVLVEQSLHDARSRADGRLLVTRVGVRGTTRAASALADRERLQEEVSLVADRSGVTLEKVSSRTQPPDEQGRVEPELLQAIETACQALVTDADRLREIARPLERELGRPLRAGAALDLRDDATLAALASDAVAGLIAQLAAEER
jgi:DNA repair exonuclease SbcCD nuclease subunit